MSTDKWEKNCKKKTEIMANPEKQERRLILWISGYE